MHPYCFSGTGIARPDESLFPAGLWLTSAGLYGKGVFTTIRLIGGSPWLWDRHWARVETSTERIGFRLTGIDERFAREALQRLIEANELDRGLARLTFLDTAHGPYPNGFGSSIPVLLIHSRDLQAMRKDLSVTGSPHLTNSTSPIAGVKSCNYLEQVIAYQAARHNGFDEAIRLNENGHVASACMANVFWETEGKLFTPSVSTGCLPGTTREFVLENFACDEVESGIEALRSADRIFLTSAGLGVAPIAEFDERNLDTSDHPLLHLIPE